MSALLDPQNQLTLLDPRLRTMIGAAAGRLPPEWQAEIIEASAVAVELRLVNPRRHRLVRYSEHERGKLYQAYRLLADLVFEAQRRLYPDLEHALAWGGNWTDAEARWQLGHFDLAGWRGEGQYRRPQDRETTDPVRAGERKRLTHMVQ